MVGELPQATLRRRRRRTGPASNITPCPTDCSAYWRQLRCRDRTLDLAGVRAAQPHASSGISPDRSAMRAEALAILSRQEWKRCLNISRYLRGSVGSISAKALIPEIWAQ